VTAARTAPVAAVIVLAAGEGTRMRSATPKVLHAIGGRTLLGHVLAATGTLNPDHLAVVIGHGREAVAEHLAAVAPKAQPVVQEEQHGTGHAVRVALEALPPLTGTVVVVAGDTPLLTAETLSGLVAAHASAGAAATVLSAVLDDPAGYGRVLRAPDGSVAGIVEQKDADDHQRAVREVNSGMYAFGAAELAAALAELTRDNAQGEEYLTDVLGILRAQGRPVAAVAAEDPHEILGVNDRAQLAEAGRLLRDRVVRRWMREGVTVVDPATTWIDVDVELHRDAVVQPHTQLLGKTLVATGAEVGPDTTLRDCLVGEGAHVRRCDADRAVVGPQASVGPFTYLRPGTVLGPGSRAGAYVELKNAVVGEGSKVPHLSYVGDAEIGVGSNIGAATVFVNYDGVAKHHTTIGDHVRIGSDTMLVAPLEVGDGAYTAAGSVITEDVPPGAMAVGRARQRVIEGWVERKRGGTASAEAARTAREAAGQDGTRSAGGSGEAEE
jgi:bifunctional UDP-N-acetylglucosamine pyrophosphorylase/glucosamine-1-phosphate N-acetyltransferase